VRPPTPPVGPRTQRPSPAIGAAIYGTVRTNAWPRSRVRRPRSATECRRNVSPSVQTCRAFAWRDPGLRSLEKFTDTINVFLRHRQACAHSCRARRYRRSSAKRQVRAPARAGPYRRSRGQCPGRQRPAPFRCRRLISRVGPPVPTVLLRPTWPPDGRANPQPPASPSPVSLPSGFVVNKGSSACRNVSGGSTWLYLTRPRPDLDQDFMVIRISHESIRIGFSQMDTSRACVVRPGGRKRSVIAPWRARHPTVIASQRLSLRESREGGGPRISKVDGLR
jgi:hypothetical protein